MTEGVVHALEVVEVEQYERVALGVRSLRKKRLGALVEGLLVEYAGEQVGACFCVEKRHCTLYGLGDALRNRCADSYCCNFRNKTHNVEEYFYIVLFLQDYLRWYRADNIPVVAAGVDRHKVVVVHYRSRGLAGNTGEDIGGKRGTGLVLA